VRVNVLFFGVLREIAGTGEDRLELAPGATLDAVFEHYARLHPRLGDMRSNVMLARNQRLERPDAAVADGDEIALLPPVSGGASPFIYEIADPVGHFFALTREPIDCAALKNRIRGTGDGAIVSFDGSVRDNTDGRRTLGLEYDCYEPMAIDAMAAIGRELAQAFAISRIGMIHRLGSLAPGEIAVSIAVAAPHRAPAFEACAEAITRLKQRVPIWKKERFEDGEVWAEGAWDPSVKQA
jgi:molybdopterin converting factor subunit 1